MTEMSLLPREFSRFYSQLAVGPGEGFSLVREDGTILARNGVNVQTLGSQALAR